MAQCGCPSGLYVRLRANTVRSTGSSTTKSPRSPRTQEPQKPAFLRNRFWVPIDVLVHSAPVFSAKTSGDRYLDDVTPKPDRFAALPKSM